LPKRSRSSVGVLLAIGALGCAPGGDDASPATYAGYEAGSPRLVEWSTAPEWSAEQELRIGSVDDSLYALTDVRFMEVGPDGTMYTLHPSERVIRIFDASGTLLSVLGGQGDGPGEFQSPGAMGMFADTLWVLDFRGYRFSFFSLAGTYLSSLTVPYASIQDPYTIQPPRAYGILFDGTVYGEPPAFSSMVADGTLTHRLIMPMTRDGQVTDTLPPIAFGRNQWAISEPDGSGGFYRAQPFPDGPMSSLASDERALFIVDRGAPTAPTDATFRVSKLSFEGDTLFSTVVDFDPVPVEAAEVDSILDSVGSFMAERGIFGVTAAQARALAEATLYRPAFKAGAINFRLAKNGDVWLGGGRNVSGLEEWLVLDRNGAPVGRLPLPGGVRPLVVDPPLLWGVEVDEFDVPYVVRYRMTRS
jgi:hypothetical protein